MRSCLDCGAPSRGSRCPTHQAQHEAMRDAQRGTTTQRGLGWQHQRQRDQMVAAAGLTHCPRCGREITEANPITGEHGTARVHGGTEITELICKSCNSSSGATVRRNPGGGFSHRKSDIP